MRQLRTMQRARRLAFVAVLPLLGVLALAGCRSEPGVAAYAGSTKYTVEQVDALVGEVKGRLSDFGPARQLVLSWLIINDLGRAELERRHVSPKPGDVKAIEAQLGLEPGSPLAKLNSDLTAVLDGLGSSLTPVDPTEAEQREVYSHVDAGGGQLRPFEDVRDQLGKDAIGLPIALQRELKELVVAGKVQVNPRYAPVSFPVNVRLNGATSQAIVPLSGSTTSPVTEASGSA